MIKYYQEKETGDYLCIDTHTLGIYGYSGRAVAIAGLPSSMATVTITPNHIQEYCNPIDRSAIPAAWREWFKLGPTVLIPETDADEEEVYPGNIQPGEHCIAFLLRQHRLNPNAIDFIADMIEK